MKTKNKTNLTAVLGEKTLQNNTSKGVTTLQIATQRKWQKPEDKKTSAKITANPEFRTQQNEDKIPYPLKMTK